MVVLGKIKQHKSGFHKQTITGLPELLVLGSPSLRSTAGGDRYLSGVPGDRRFGVFSPLPLPLARGIEATWLAPVFRAPAVVARFRFRLLACAVVVGAACDPWKASLRLPEEGEANASWSEMPALWLRSNIGLAPPLVVTPRLVCVDSDDILVFLASLTALSTSLLKSDMTVTSATAKSHIKQAEHKQISVTVVSETRSKRGLQRSKT